MLCEIGKKMDIYIVDENFKGSLESRLEQSVLKLLKIIKDKEQYVKNILKLNIFLQTDNEEELSDVSGELISVLKKEFSKNIPAYTLVSQPSLSGNNVLIEGFFLEKSTDVRIERNTFYQHPYVVLSSGKNKPRMILSGGIKMPDEGDITFECQRVFDFAEQLLLKEDMDFRNITGQWNYVPLILSYSKYGNEETQNISIYNKIRSLYFSPELFPNGLPELTVTGALAGSITLDFVAISGKTDVENIYGYGRCLTGVLPEDVKQKNVGSQTEAMINDLKEKAGKGTLNHLRVYLKNEKDHSTVKNIIDENIHAENIVYIKADMHDDEIKIHMEAFV